MATPRCVFSTPGQPTGDASSIGGAVDLWPENRMELGTRRAGGLPPRMRNSHSPRVRTAGRAGGSGQVSTLVAEQPALEAAPRLPRAETLAASVIIILMMTVAQRLIGFGRGVMFCRWLSAEELGQWDVAMAFLNLAAPLAVLGLPGSFGRYALDNGRAGRRGAARAALVLGQARAVRGVDVGDQPGRQSC